MVFVQTTNCFVYCYENTTKYYGSTAAVTAATAAAAAAATAATTAASGAYHGYSSWGGGGKLSYPHI